MVSFEFTGERFLDYLRTRSTETWVFFAAGVILNRVGSPRASTPSAR